MVNTKALQKQLFAAIAMVLVAVIAVSSSTYAWFATNTSVETSAMSVTASSADPYLQIKLAEDDTYSTSVTLPSATGLKLVAPSSITGTTVAWYEAKSNDPNQAVTGQFTEDSVEVVADGTATHMIKQELTLRNSSNVAASNLEVDATISTADGTKLDHAARILVVSANGSVLFDSTGTPMASTTPAITTDATLASTMAANATVPVVVYMYFDGTDELAKNVTDVSATALTATLTFRIQGDPNHSSASVQQP